MPAPYESCIVCMKGDVTTGIASEGEPEWHIAWLQKLGVPEAEATPTFHQIAQEMGCDPGMVPDRDTTIVIRLCEECAGKAGVPVAKIEEGGTLPAIQQGDQMRKGE